ncbi:MAG: hypothetical protein HY883_03630 [Deltaproteobacteria bacterium]|nr:hypothetical protein [Deltaproteobacteria bacterium]
MDKHGIKDESAPSPYPLPRRGEEEKNEEGRDYTRHVYQNLMAIVDALEENATLPLTQKELQKSTGLSKNVVFDVSWNLCKKGWAEDMGDGSLRLKRTQNDKDSWVGRMVRRAVRDAYGKEIKAEDSAE